MSDKRQRGAKKPPEISPYVFPILLAGFGAWCFYDGWLTSDPKMQDYKMLNQIASAVLLPWAVYDFWKVRKRTGAEKRNDPDSPETN